MPALIHNQRNEKMNLARSYAMFKIILFGHVLVPLWWSREHRRARRCAVLTSVIPNYFKRYLSAVDDVKESKVIHDDKNEKIFTLWLQGEANARQWLKDHEDAQKELLDKIMAKSSGIAEEMTTGPMDEDDGGTSDGD